MRSVLTILFITCISAQSKYPADSLLVSSNVSIIHKIGLLPIAGWQRISYNTNLFNCQFYPSCSNYGAASVRQFGIIRGGIMASERITRCNPFAFHYHLELHHPFHDKNGRLIDPVVQKQITHSKKSPSLRHYFQRSFQDRVVSIPVVFWMVSWACGLFILFTIQRTMQLKMSGPLPGLFLALPLFMFTWVRSTGVGEQPNITRKVIMGLEPVSGFEPPTCSLRKNCSTPELHWQILLL